MTQSFNTPLRFWSFAFGIWLLIVLAMTAARLVSAESSRWFTGALITSWMFFVVTMAVVNPDLRIAENNFANPPPGVDQFIPVNPLIWLSDDATPTIVENIDVLIPLPNQRFERVRDHLCSAEDFDSWRDSSLSRSAAAQPRAELCDPR